MSAMNRMTKRSIYLLVLFVIICIGLYSKRMTGIITEIIDFKDVVWAMMVYFLFRIVFIDWSIKKIAVIGILFSFMVEVSQLYHADWIDKLRETYLGELILGSGFVWSDLLAYLCGIGFGIIIDYLIESYLINRLN
jgi:glycopeptide antibiotics resistance protein